MPAILPTAEQILGLVEEAFYDDKGSARAIILQILNDAREDMGLPRKSLVALYWDRIERACEQPPSQRPVSVRYFASVAERDAFAEGLREGYVGGPGESLLIGIELRSGVDGQQWPCYMDVVWL